MTNDDLLKLAIYLGSGIAIGFIAKLLIIPLLMNLTRRTKWKSDDIIINSIKGWVVFWSVMVAALMVLPLVEIRSNLSNTLHDIIIAALILSFTFVIARIIGQFISLKTSAGGAILPSTSIVSNIVKIIVYVIGLLFLLQSLGVSITPLLTALGVGGLAVALALQETLTNLFAGVQIITSGKMKVEDYVQLDSGEEGYIVDISWRSTALRSLPNHLIIVPNSKMANAIVRNYTLPESEMSTLINVGVSYASDLEKVERVTIDVAKEVLREIQGGVAEFEPFIRYNTFNESSIDFTVILRVKQFVDQYPVKHEFVKRLQKRYKQENIEIPFPIRTVYLKQEQENQKEASKE